MVTKWDLIEWLGAALIVAAVAIMFGLVGGLLSSGVWLIAQAWAHDVGGPQR